MSESTKMSQKAFWEALESRLAACSPGELRDILRRMAQQVGPLERRGFLGMIGPADRVAATRAAGQESLLADIDGLAQELAAAMEEAEPWEEDYGYEWGGYDDDYAEGESEEQYKEFVRPTIELFDRADAAFDDGRMTLAAEAYRKLFVAILGAEDDYGGGLSTSTLEGVDIGEARARYLRAVYETEPSHQRVAALFARMREARTWQAGEGPMFDDLIQVSPRPLPDAEQFLADWVTFLRQQTGGDADAWLREAVRLAQGTQGLEALARAEGRTRPYAYLDWFKALEEEGQFQIVLVEAAEALQVLPARLPVRAEVADHLYAAAARLGDTQTQHLARSEAFLVRPTLRRLLDLWDLHPADEDRQALMKRAAAHIRDVLSRRPARQAATWTPDRDLDDAATVDGDVLVHALLLAGDIEEARQLVANQQVLGWTSTSSAQGLVVAFLLALLSGERLDALPPGIAQIWRWGLDHTTGYEEGQGHARQRLERAYAERMSAAPVPPGRQNTLLAWCLKVAEQRVDAIVGKQHRKSYHKAAALTAACAEALQARGAAPAAEAFVEQIRNRFPRHRAFQADLRSAMG